MAAKTTAILHGQAIEVWDRSFRITGLDAVDTEGSGRVFLDENNPEKTLKMLSNALEAYRKGANNHIIRKHKKDMFGADKL